MKVYFHAPKEDWIVDRFKKEWDEDNADISVPDLHQASVMWLCADWCWKDLFNHFSDPFRTKKVLVTVHHIVPEKFKVQDAVEFKFRDEFVTAYHVPNQHTYDFIRPLTEKPIHVIGYWANQKIWRKTGEKNELRMKHSIPLDAYVIGSFQRDTEGAGIPHGVFEPKREKGPDLLADYAEVLVTQHEREPFFGYPAGPHVLLAGWRRQYLTSRFTNFHVPFSYIEMPSQETLNELYQTLDVYPVTARQEGGPQSLIECGLLDVPVVSRDVGMARQVLKAPFGGECCAIADCVEDARPLVPDVSGLVLPLGYEPYRRLLRSL